MTSLLIAVSLAVGFLTMGSSASAASKQAAEALAAVRTTPLEKGSLQSTISATGAVYSVSAVEVYSNQNYPVDAIHVVVGDVVAEGDLLAELDGSSLQSDINQKQASVWASQQSAQQSLKNAQSDLAIYQKNLDNNYDTNLINAESSVKSAESEVKAAELDVETSELEVESARLEVYNARNKLMDYNQNNSSDLSSDQYTTYEGSSYDSSKADLEASLSSKEIARDKAIANLDKAQNNLEKARDNLDKAIASLDATVAGSDDKIVSYQNSVDTAKVSNNFNDQYISIQKMQNDLSQCTISAPVAGTVTAVNAVEGGSGSGMLFVIQSTNELKIKTNIPEYDIGAVSIGDAVVITAEATGDQEFSGKLSSIAPTSTLTADGSAAASTEAEYEAEITVSSTNTDLKIGMNTRLNIVTEEAKNVFYAPYEAVETREDGKYIYVKKTEGESVSFAEIPVTTGLETNSYIEIQGVGLEEGMEIARNAGDVNGGGQASAAADTAEQNPDMEGMAPPEGVEPSEGVRGSGGGMMGGLGGDR